ncbi:MAG: hypothetical protein M1835_000404 [Candelina submexicana]|nr:MAG: hypothetical protein M1835_000404 [Candelina submexicana]
MASRPTASRTTTASGVRRNLFHPHLSRRPTSSTASNSTSATTILQTSPEDNSDDIVIRDKNGNYQVEVPLMPIEQNDDPHEKEKIEARLVELFRDQSRRQPSEPAELLAAVQASLRNKAASLQEDNWMYEGEEEGGS